MPTGRIDTHILETPRAMVFTLRNEVMGEILLMKLADTYASLACPWEYDHILDLRRFTGLIEFDALIGSVQQWRQRVKRPGGFGRFAAITSDSLRIARANAYGPMFADIDYQTFATMELAKRWLSKPVQPRVSQ